MRQNTNKSDNHFDHKLNFCNSVHDRSIVKNYIFLVIALFIACFVTSCDSFSNNTEFSKRAAETMDFLESIQLSNNTNDETNDSGQSQEVTTPSEPPGQDVPLEEPKENIVFNSEILKKTPEIVVIPAGETVTIVGSNGNWNTYYSGITNSYKGVFIYGRKVCLSPYIMSAYEVTSERLF